MTTKTGLYPLHVAIDSGFCWEDGLDQLVEAYPPAAGLSVWQGRGREKGVYPFQYAAMQKGAVDVIYHLLLIRPDLLACVRSQTRKKPRHKSQRTKDASIPKGKLWKVSAC